MNRDSNTTIDITVEGYESVTETSSSVSSSCDDSSPSTNVPSIAENPITCKICLKELKNQKEQSFRPCKCNSAVCHKCLEQWINHSKNTSCQICRTNYVIQYEKEIRCPGIGK